MTVISRLRRKHMAPQQPADGSAPESRPGLSRLASFSRSFDRSDRDSLKQLKKALTFGDANSSTEKGLSRGAPTPDTFETGEHSDADEEIEMTRASIDLDDLPIELITLIDGFVESLSAKVHPTPPNIQKLSQLFQDFYTLASSHINTHINTLALRHSYGVTLDSTPPHSSPSPSSTISSAASRLRSKASSLGSRDKPRVGLEQQMITPEELANRKKARRALEAQRNLLEEAVERRLCEGIYDRIYRHRSTQDEAQDAKLRSKTAALALVGIGPSELGVVLGEDGDQDEKAATEKTSEIREQLEAARKDIIRMSESRYPLGKLNRLKAAHKSIVDTLAHFHPSASADEIMPMLIYTLITLPPDNLHAISDLSFIQNFRWEVKLNGEAAYCLTNLEAAISFLETVDLATLRADEQSAGQDKSASRQNVSVSPRSTAAPSTENAAAPKPETPNATLKPEVLSANRRLSDLVNTPAQAIGAASDAVFSTADHGLKTISSSLGESYNFFLGKLKERQDSPKESIVVPKTLDDARKLMSTPPPPEEDDNASEDVDHQLKVPRREDRPLSLLDGRRESSADSTRSGRSASSSKKVNFADDPRGIMSAAASAASQQSPAVLEQMRYLGNTFNPMARLSGLSIRGFGRSASIPAPVQAAAPSPSSLPKDAKDLARPIDGGDLAAAFPDIAAALPPQVPSMSRIAPPNTRFLELENPGDLKLDEVVYLLKDYRRLAEALSRLDAFETQLH
ncbi:Vacuolar protein sorting-associated protein 9b [Escovopsis weberi]|uniref:Vacuolar protein sorting-associated protein 9b n=1 Tax=Escovopsis weberi TaxID=150374 RepID=A0A0M9VSR4_ESCWE|nr:Vacuolar protein sorting-associated protein 9b [Escovopsis weberi]